MSKFTFGTEKRLKSKYEFAKVFEATKDLSRPSKSKKPSVNECKANDNIPADVSSPESLSANSTCIPIPKGFRFANNYFSILAIDADKKKARLGLVVAKKNLRYAVQRNRFKRLTREFFRLHPELLALDYVIMARSGFTQIADDSQQVFFEYDRAFNNLKRQVQKS